MRVEVRVRDVEVPAWGLWFEQHDRHQPKAQRSACCPTGAARMRQRVLELQRALYYDYCRHVRSRSMEAMSSEVAPRGSSSFNPAYVGARIDLLALVDTPPSTVLDVGCATGASGELLRDRHGSRVTGIELDPRMAEVARQRLFAVHVADLNQSSISEVVGSERYDLILLGDVLEHLIDPWGTLAQAQRLLSPGGRIIASLPNVAHYSTIVSLMFFRRWPYRDRGIHDRTHLRFFTRKNLVDLYAGAGLSIAREHRKLRLLEAPSPINAMARWLDFQPFRTYLTFQYIHLLGRSCGEPTSLGR